MTIQDYIDKRKEEFEEYFLDSDGDWHKAHPVVVQSFHAETLATVVKMMRENIQFINEFDRERGSDEYDSGMKYMKQLILNLIPNIELK